MSDVRIKYPAYETIANKAFAFKAQTELLIKKDFTAFDKYWQDPYPQHNPLLESGVKNVRAFMEKYLPDCTVEIVRVIGDGDIVTFHQHITGKDAAPDIVELDIYRVNNQKLIEHWNVIQFADEATNGNTMLEGSVKFEDREKTEDNRNLVTTFMIEVILGGDIGKLDKFVADNLVQHDPKIKQGKEGLRKHLNKAHYGKSGIVYYSLHHIIAEANFVWTASELDYSDQQLIIYDLWRVSNNKIAEHWSISQIKPLVTKSGLAVILD